MAKIQAVWAIDIGQAAIKALKLAPGDVPGQAIAEAFDYVEYPKILSQPDADPEELIREALATFVGRNELKGSKVVIGVPGQSGLVKFIKLPPVEKKRIPDIVKFEARQQIPFALEEVIWDYQQIGGDDGDDDDGGFTMAEVGLFAMKRDQINRAILPFKTAGIEVDIVQMGPIALYNFAAFDLPKGEGEDEKASVVLLDVGADNTDLIITDGVRIWQRNVPIGGNHFTRALTKELKLTFAKAEHLKRNATKAPDPRAVFTAMRGTFNDFSSEVSRSIGFYSSVNRTAKILKVVGLGNGFKLPGLQKFLQQNLSYEVEKHEGFTHLVGEEVLLAPQFQENMPSFAVAYGLAVQGLGYGPLKTNLLPPELEQVRMIRRKKPWTLVAAALLMLGFTSLFLGDWRALAKVDNPAFVDAIAQAKQATDKGNGFKSAFDTAKAAFSAKKKEGEGLVGTAAAQANWPLFLKTLNQALPNPAKQLRDIGIDPASPQGVPILDRLRVHIDAVKPVWRENLLTEWYESGDLDTRFKSLMLPVDRDKPPGGPGWVIQVVGHHYNPAPLAKNITPEERALAKGPIFYLVDVVMPSFYTPELRAFGFHHLALANVEIDTDWTSEKGATTRVFPMPLLTRAKGAASSSGGAGGGMPGGKGSGPGPGSSMGMSLGPVGGAYRGEGGMMGMGMGGMKGGMGGTQAKDVPKPITLTRTDFLLQFVWQPLAPDAPPPDLAPFKKEIEESLGKLDKSPLKIDEDSLLKASREKSEKAIKQEIEGVPAAAPKAAPPTPPAPPAAPPGTTPPPVPKG